MTSEDVVVMIRGSLSCAASLLNCKFAFITWMRFRFSALFIVLHPTLISIQCISWREPSSDSLLLPDCLFLLFFYQA